MKKKIVNWPEYNRSLVQRGSITVWFSEDSIKRWRSSESTGARGRPRIYSDDAILCALIVRSVYRLPLRALVGFLLSLVQLLVLPLKVPSYTQICRRAKALGKALGRLSRRLPTDIVFDSTGLKVYGEGEWKVRQHGTSKRRTWRKLHIGIDPESGEIIVAELTDNAQGDGEVGQKLLKQAPKSIKVVYGDGGYDGLEFRRAIEKHGAEPIIPPPRNAVVREGTDGATTKRNDAIAEIKGLEYMAQESGLGGVDLARKSWKFLKRYHKRSLAETAMYRYKQLTGDRLHSREFERQRVEAHVRCRVLNTMIKLGKPAYKWRAAA